MSQPEITAAGQPAAYDANFCFPVRELESERVKAQLPIPDLYEFIPWDNFTDTSDFVKQVIDTRILLYAVIDKTRTSTNHSSSANFAGIIGYINTSPADLSTEIYVIILPPFQRTHVTTNAIGLLLQYAFDLPPHGLGLRRVQWKANKLNTKSIGTGQKLGIFAGSKASATNGVKEREGDPCPGAVGTDTALLALCWDDWESERARVLQAMDRRS
ncbi:acyl-CoA N-acyltransferase [Suillus lakei]|nr:acyl-CoA N-acyltransferase [Suillus lakei]